MKKIPRVVFFILLGALLWTASGALAGHAQQLRMGAEEGASVGGAVACGVLAVISLFTGFFSAMD